MLGVISQYLMSIVTSVLTNNQTFHHFQNQITFNVRKHPNVCFANELTILAS